MIHNYFQERIEINMSKEIFTLDGEYIYKGEKLDNSTMRDLLVYLYKDKRFKRQAAIANVMRFHSEHGGIVNVDAHEPEMFRWCIIKLSEEYDVKDVGPAEWLISNKNMDI